MLSALLFLPLAFQPADPWVEPMRKVHGRFQGTKGTLALFGDSITVSQAFWTPLAGRLPGGDADTLAAQARVQKYLKKECWNQWRGPAFGSEGGMTVRWADKNVDAWLKKLNPEAAVLLFGTNDLGQVPLAEYEQKMGSVVDRCLKNGTVVLLTTLPPRHGRVELSSDFAEALRRIARQKQIPLIDFHAEILRRRPQDWNGALPQFKEFKDVYQVPTLISGDGVHPSNPAQHRDLSENSLSRHGYLLRSVLTLKVYAEVIEKVLDPTK